MSQGTFFSIQIRGFESRHRYLRLFYFYNLQKTLTGLFGGGWFVEGNIETYVAENGLTDEDIRQNGIVSHKVDYIRYWKELEPLRKFLSDQYFSTFKAHLVIITICHY